MFYYFVNLSLFNNTTGVHHSNSVAEFSSQSQVVGDQDDRGAPVLVDTLHKIQDLGLDGYIESGGWLVC
jgi:hypothetical protein